LAAGARVHWTVIATLDFLGVEAEALEKLRHPLRARKLASFVDR
jgi:hypothetical protein